MRRVVLLLLAPIFIAACAGATTQSAGSGSRTDLGTPAPAVDAVKSGSAAAGNAVQQGIPNPIVVNPDRSVILTAKQSEEQRYLALIARASTIDEILKIDASLSNVRTQIEQLTGQINSIKSRTDFSTIVLTVSPAAVLPGEQPSSGWDPAKTFTRALAALGTMLRVFADFGIWLLVFGWIPLLALALVLVATRVRSRPATPVA